jgi:cellulose synthase (UDP-forming)
MVQNLDLPIVRVGEKYKYVVKNDKWFKVLYIISILFWFLALFGFYISFQRNLTLAIIYTPILIFLTCFYLISKYVNLFYKQFNVSKHRSYVRKYWQMIFIKPTIDLFLPIAGEDIHIVNNTWEGVLNLQKEYGSNLNVYVLDDKGSGIYEDLANHLGFHYLSRPNKGEFKKAGNLRYGMERSDGEFVIIFDADFRPTEQFIHDLLPYMWDSKVSIVQSPQYFDTNSTVEKRSWLEYGAGNIQEYFYKIIQVSRDRFGGAICVGTNAIYRRKALDSIGGTALREHSEDVWTGFKTISKGWKIKYIPLILAKGVCPDDLNAFFKQQTRWCSGSLSLMMSKEFWFSPVKISTKIPYISGFTFYFSHLFALSLPFQVFVLMLNGQFSPRDSSLLVFVPTILNSFLLMAFHQYPRARLGTILAYVTASWAYAYAILSIVFRVPEKWQPTGANTSLSAGFKRLFWLSNIYYVTYIGLVIFAIWSDKLVFDSSRFFLTDFWITLNLFVQTLFIVMLWRFRMSKIVLGNTFFLIKPFQRRFFSNQKL